MSFVRAGRCFGTTLGPQRVFGVIAEFGTGNKSWTTCVRTMFILVVDQLNVPCHKDHIWTLHRFRPVS